MKRGGRRINSTDRLLQLQLWTILIMEDEKRRKKKNKLHRQVVAITTVDYASLMASLIAETIDSDDDDSGEAKEKENHRTFPRGKRKVYDHDHCAIGLNRDYLRLVPLFDGKEFETMFRISKSRFQRLMEDIAASQNSFYLNTVDACWQTGILLSRQAPASPQDNGIWSCLSHVA
jgi:hypothetical protein